MKHRTHDRSGEMKKGIRNKIRLGIFISIGISVFIIGIYFIGERQQLFRNTFRVSGVFKDIAGLQSGNNVRLSGINVGIVEKISIVSDTSVRVDVLIEENARKFIKKDAVAGIGSEGLMGNKVLIIYPGTGGKMEIEDEDSVKTVQPASIDDIFLSLKSTIDNTSNITNDLSKITYNIQSGKGTIGRLLMDKTLREKFDSTFANLKDGSTGFKLLMERADQIDTIMMALRKTLDNTSNITNDVSKITDNIQSGKGTIGRLLMDPSWRLNFDTTLVNMKRTSAGLQIVTDKARKSWLLWGF
jgi:phospholipid/cholesterol/gamma-HCH transport system substrate-binding protein